MEQKRCRNCINIKIIHEHDESGISEEIIDTLKGEIVQCFSRGSNRDKFCDFTVVVRATEFPCHRFVLSACSGFFEAMLRTNMKERQEMRATIHGISPEIFKVILDVIYGSCEEVLAPNNMIDVWGAAHQLQIQCLISACESYVMNNIDVKNSYLVYTHARLLQSPRVTSSVLNHMVEHFFAHVQYEHFVNIDSEDFLQIIGNKNLQVCSDFKIKAVLKWCGAENHNYERSESRPKPEAAKLPLLGNLIQHVDLAKATRGCLASLLTNPFILGDKIASLAVNWQAAEILVNDHKVKYEKIGKTSCQHCSQNQRFFTDDSDSEDFDDSIFH